MFVWNAATGGVGWRCVRSTEGYREPGGGSGSGEGAAAQANSGRILDGYYLVSVSFSSFSNFLLSSLFSSTLLRAAIVCLLTTFFYL